ALSQGRPAPDDRAGADRTPIVHRSALWHQPCQGVGDRALLRAEEVAVAGAEHHLAIFALPASLPFSRKTTFVYAPFGTVRMRGDANFAVAAEPPSLLYAT